MNQQIKVSHLQIAILLMILKLTLDLKHELRKDNIIPYQDQLQQPAWNLSHSRVQANPTVE